jgi:hypothetical protein
VKRQAAPDEEEAAEWQTAVGYVSTTRQGRVMVTSGYALRLSKHKGLEENLHPLGLRARNQSQPKETGDAKLQKMRGPGRSSNSTRTSYQAYNSSSLKLAFQSVSEQRINFARSRILVSIFEG